MIKQFLYRYTHQQVTNAPLVTFRVLWGLILFFSTIRFAWKGWIVQLYIRPDYHFPFIEGLSPLPGGWMYMVFWGLAVSAILMAFGFWYRFAAITFFVLFTYVELLDKSNYLNHYYFVSLISFLMIWLPAHRRFSLDVSWRHIKGQKTIPIGYLNVLRLQLSCVYFFAGIAKINSDWLLHAQPMKLWLSAQTHKPIIGLLFRYKLTAYLFSWMGMLYDLSIPLWLSLGKTRKWAYILVVIFHIITWYLFPIGMFPWIMILATLLFFPAKKHEMILSRIEQFFHPVSQELVVGTWGKTQQLFFGAFISIQLLLPMRYLFYPGDLFWTESGFRFSWRVMLMEKAGDIQFEVTEGDRQMFIANYDYLTPQQEKMMATQPDMILQFVAHLEEELQNKGFKDPVITAYSQVSLNGRPSRTFVLPNVDLTGPLNTFDRTQWLSSYD